MWEGKLCITAIPHAYILFSTTNIYYVMLQHSTFVTNIRHHLHASANTTH